MKKIDILITDFAELGAQRVAINIANILMNFFDVRLIVIENRGPFKNYLNKDIPILDLESGSISIPKIRIFHKAMIYNEMAQKNKTDLTICFAPIMNFYALYAKRKNKNLKVIIQEHAFPSLSLKDRGNVRKTFEFLFRYYFVRWYNGADYFITISKEIKNDFQKNFGLTIKKIKIIRNPVDICMIEKMANETIDDFAFKDKKKYIIAVGRLVEVKNFKRLLKIFSMLKNKDAELIILGKGPEKTLLNEYAKKLNVEDRLHLLGFKNNPYKYMAKANVFCLTSNTEGLPQVIAESMVCRTLVIAHKCKSGPEEMIINGETGILVEYNDLEDFANKIDRILDGKIDNNMVDRAYNYARKEYSINKIMQDYLDVVNELIGD